MNDIKRQAASWFVRMQHTAQQHPERAAFNAWLQANPRHAEEYQAFAALWDDLQSTQHTKALADALQVRHSRRRFIRHSALGLLLLGAGGSWLYQAQISERPQQLQTRHGQFREKRLADGSLLQLAGQTRLQINLTQQQRHLLLLEGQAIFDVARDPLRPFIVDTPASRIEVLGTRFSLNLLPAGLRISVTHGQVQASNHAGEIRLVKAGEVLEIAHSGALRYLPGNPSHDFAFTQGRLVFAQAGLAEVAHVLSRYQASPISASGASTGPRIDAIVHVDDIPGFLQALPDIAPVRVEQQKAGVLLSPQ